MSIVREAVKSTLQILKSRALPVGHISNRSNGAIWKKINLTGDKRWSQIKAPFQERRLKENVAPSDRKLESSIHESSNDLIDKFLTPPSNQPLLFSKESFAKKQRIAPQEKNAEAAFIRKPVYSPKEPGTLESLRNEIKETLEAGGQTQRAKEYIENSKVISELNKLLNISYKYVSISSENVNQITRSIISNTVKEVKQSHSEAMRGNQNAAGEHNTQANPIQEIKANSLVKVVKEFEGIPLSLKDSEYLDQIKDSLSKNLIPPAIALQISETLSKIPVKESPIVLKVLRNYFSNSLLTYNSKIDAIKIDDSNPLKRAVLATKFRNLADGMTAQIEYKQNPAISQQRPTRRRSGIAWGMMEDAKRLREVQAVLKGMSREIEEGILPESLKTIRSKSDVETLLSDTKYIHREIERGNRNSLPEKIEVRLSKFDRSEFFEKNEKLQINTGGKLYGHTIHWAHKMGLISKEDYKEVLNFKADHAKESDYIYSSDVKEIERFYKLKDLVYRIENYIYPVPASSKTKKVVTIEGKPFELVLKNHKVYENRNSSNLKLLRLGFTTTKEVEEAGNHLRNLIKEYSYGGAPTEKEIKIKKLENELVGRKIPGFFPTPKSLGKTMIDSVDIQLGMDVLEPSAGKGDLSDLIKKEGVDPDTIEPVSDLREILKEKGHKLVGSDFLQFNEKMYDRIVMNPPFEKGADIDHVRHAYSLLKPGGKLVSIMSEGPFFRSDNKSRLFRSWLEEIGGDSEKLPDDSFSGSESFRQTGVNTRLITITKY